MTSSPCPRRRATAGFTLLELIVAVVIGAIGLTSLTLMKRSTDVMEEESRAHMLAAAEHRNSVDHLATLLRDCVTSRLDGFDMAGTSIEPGFERVLGWTDGARRLSGPESLAWRAEPGPVPGVSAAGRLAWVHAGREERIAAHVPQGGFTLRREGRSLVICLTTYHVTSGRRVASISSETSISLRN